MKGSAPELESAELENIYGERDMRQLINTIESAFL